MSEREYKIDNIRFVLILLTVFGHLLELVPGSLANTIYRAIYTLFGKKVLYGSYSYAGGAYTWLQRVFLHVTAFAWIGVFFMGMPKRKIPVITAIGGRTLPVFLFHGFIILVLRKLSIFRFARPVNLLLAAVIAVGIVLMLGNAGAAWLCKWGVTGHWIPVLLKKRADQKISL